jgi:hypothetical protein
VAGSIKVKISNKLMGDNSSANVYVSVNGSTINSRTTEHILLTFNNNIYVTNHNQRNEIAFSKDSLLLRNRIGNIMSLKREYRYISNRFGLFNLSNQYKISFIKNCYIQLVLTSKLLLCYISVLIIGNFFLFCRHDIAEILLKVALNTIDKIKSLLFFK